MPIPYDRSSFYRNESYLLSDCLRVTFHLYLTARQKKPEGYLSEIYVCPRHGTIIAAVTATIYAVGPILFLLPTIIDRGVLIRFCIELFT